MMGDVDERECANKVQASLKAAESGSLNVDSQEKMSQIKTALTKLLGRVNMNGIPEI